MNFAGRWVTSFGPMLLTQEGSRVRGTYGRDGVGNAIEGTVNGQDLCFSYVEAHERGSGRFRLRRYGAFAGEYLAEGNARALPWFGWRQFDGLWDTQIGRLRLVQDAAGRVAGFAEFSAAARLEGQVTGEQLTFKLEADTFSGRGTLDLDGAGYAANGEWFEGTQPSRSLAGQRVLGRPGLIWLVVVEAHWQRALDDSEYAFGHMLGELFARVPRVQVRHRIFHDEASLLHWCHQLIYLPEPAVLVIAGHGEAGGLTVNGRAIALGKILDGLRFADSLMLVHFSSCLVGQDAEAVLAAAPFPVSGYRTSVDWAQSALIEFVYLDMVLEKGLSPAAAAEQLIALVRFAGHEEMPGAPYRPAAFCFFDGAGGAAREPPVPGAAPAASPAPAAWNRTASTGAASAGSAPAD